MFIPDGRIYACAEMLRGVPMADIGTDHAYLPIWAVSNGKAPSALATDINSGPLECAKRNIEKYGLGDKIALRISDGLCRIEEGEAEDFVIAGMGGELIARILSQKPWTKNALKRFILQPMTRETRLRKYLMENGFFVIREKAVTASKRVYTVMEAACTGEKNEGLLFPVIGLIRGETPAERMYIEKKLRELQKKILGAEGEEREKLGTLCGELEALL